jgi:predicted N-formylglutamate amidohydrolase
MPGGQPPLGGEEPGAADCVLSCEHARAAVPDGIALAPPEVLSSHAAWDPGALQAAERWARALGAPLFAGRTSRLWVDLNRSAEGPEVIPERAFGASIPGNRGVSEAERAARIEAEWRPFRAAVEQAVRAAIARAGRCVHASVHSFDPALDPAARTYPVGVLFDPDRRWEAAVAGRLLAGLRAAGLDARANQPYLGIDDGHTTALRRVFPPEAYAGLEIELNQGLLRDLERFDDVLAALETALADALREPA